jgi:metal-responsive CopG/Arc/MetJ family transcriptional regulator
LDERLVIEVPGELVEKLDYVVDLLGFRSREEFALVALRRLLDKHVALVRFVQPGIEKVELR